MASILVNRTLPEGWQLNAPGRPVNQYQHVHFGHVSVTQPGNYRVFGQCRPQLKKLSNPVPSTPPKYFTIVAGLFLADPADNGGSGAATLIPGTETNVGDTNQGQWAVPPASLNWVVNVTAEDLGEGKEFDIRFMLFVPSGFPNPTSDDWIGINGSDDNDEGRVGRAWFRVEGPI